RRLPIDAGAGLGVDVALEKISSGPEDDSEADKDDKKHEKKGQHGGLRKRSKAGNQHQAGGRRLPANIWSRSPGVRYSEPRDRWGDWQTALLMGATLL